MEIHREDLCVPKNGDDPWTGVQIVDAKGDDALPVLPSMKNRKIIGQ